jgi:hypothetical protein
MRMAAMDWTYQLVIQRPGPMRDLDEWIALEDRIRSQLGHIADVDGHDFGAADSNIFIRTNDPVLIFNLLRPLLDSISSLHVAYRTFGLDKYTILHPPGLKVFVVT